VRRKRFFLAFLVGVWGLASPALGQFDPELVGWWSFDEGSGTVAHDGSGQGNDGTFVGAPQWVSGVIGGALAFNGDNDDQVELTTPLPIGSSSNTVAVWIKVPLIGQDGLASGERVGDVLGNYNDSPNSNWELHGAGQVRLWWNNGQIDARGTTDLRDNTWHHVAWVRDQAANACTMYIDGQLETSTTTVGSDITFETTHRIGGDNRGDPPCFHGQMDDLQIYSRALSQDEITTIMDGPVDYRLASSPQPADGADDVPRDVTFGWAPGNYAHRHDVYLGTSFDDVNDAGRSNPMSVLAGEGQAVTAYAPADLLDFETTYYWRVDEVNAAPDNTIFKGDVWSFTTEPFAYPIENITATSNAASDADKGPEKTIDGSGLNDQDRHSTNSLDMWQGMPSGAEPVYLQYEFDGVYKLHEMLIWNYNVEFELLLGFGLKDVTVEYSDDGSDWSLLGNVEFAQATATDTYEANTRIAFDGVAAQYVRLTIDSAWGPTGQYGLSEVRFMAVPAAARQPQPADGASDVDVTTALTWRAGRNAVAHDVYFGSDPEALAPAGTPGEAGYDPGALDLATTYYWKVDETSDAGAIWPGKVWAFSTQEYLVVDDFESYNDEDNVIYETWIDGWVNETGSTVGYLEAPFAERTIVHGGRQALPLFVDNADVATSEADLDLVQDWSLYGVETLSLYFYGSADNTGQLYVTINNTKIAYDGAAGDIAEPSWQLWRIDLSTVDNVSNVRSLTIGVEGAGATGVIFIDDVCLYPEVGEDTPSN